MTRRLLNLLTIVSLLLCVAVVVLWVRSRQRSEGWVWRRGAHAPAAGVPGDAGGAAGLDLLFAGGAIQRDRAVVEAVNPDFYRRYGAARCRRAMRLRSRAARRLCPACG